jgi:hypothetical protein
MSNNFNNLKNKIPFLGSLRPIEMIGIGLVILALMIWGLSKCSGDKKTVTKDTEQQTETEPNGKTDALRRSLFVCIDSLRMRRAPHKDSATVVMLPYGEELTDMGEYQNEQTIKISPEVSATEPWIKVKSKDGKYSGWVFGAGVRPYPKKRPLPKVDKEDKEDKDTKKEKTGTDSKDKSKTSTKNTNKKTDNQDN